MKLKALLIAVVLLGLAACDKNRDPKYVILVPFLPVEEPKTFGVQLMDIDVRRVSTGETVEVDVADVASGNITLTD